MSLPVFPDGVNLTFQSIPKFLGAIFILLSGIFSLAVSYNLIVILTFVTSGMAAYWLVYHLLKRAVPAFFAGAFFAFSPYHLDQQSHINLLPTMLVPVFILLIIKGKEAMDDRTGKGLPLRQRLNFILAGVVLGLIAYDTEHYAIFLIVFCLLYLLFYLPYRCARGQWKHWLRLMGNIYLSLVIAAIIFFPMLLAAVRYLREAGNIITNNFLSFERSYLGLVILLLAAAGAWSYWRVLQTRLWVLAALVFSILSLGPVLYVNGASTACPCLMRSSIKYHCSIRSEHRRGMSPSPHWRWRCWRDTVSTRSS